MDEKNDGPFFSKLSILIINYKEQAASTVKHIKETSPLSFYSRELVSESGRVDMPSKHAYLQTTCSLQHSITREGGKKRVSE